MRTVRTLLLVTAALTGCEQSDVHRGQSDGESRYGLSATVEPASLTDVVAGRTRSEELRTFDVVAPDSDPERPRIAGPQITYVYEVGYRLDRAAIATVQSGQIGLCTRLGAPRCFVVKSNIDSDDQHYSTASTTLMIDARLATSFGKRLDAAVAGAGGTVARRSTNAEDVTKQVIDTDAKVRAKEALADRLLGLIRTANGKFGDLVAAEKAYADTQQELAATRSLQAELRQRVAMSRYELGYSSVEATGTLSPIRRAFAFAGEAFGASVGALVTFFIVSLPWALALAALIWLPRRLGVRGPIAWWRARRAARTSD